MSRSSSRLGVGGLGLVPYLHWLSRRRGGRQMPKCFACSSNTHSNTHSNAAALNKSCGATVSAMLNSAPRKQPTPTQINARSSLQQIHRSLRPDPICLHKTRWALRKTNTVSTGSCTSYVLVPKHKAEPLLARLMMEPHSGASWPGGCSV